MTIVSRTSGNAYAHRCLYCGQEWSSDEEKPPACPRCSESTLPTSERIARLVRKDKGESSQRMRAHPEVEVEPDAETASEVPPPAPPALPD